MEELPIDPEFVKELFRSMEEEERKTRDERFAGWCRMLESLPEDFGPKLPDGIEADLELQPFRWMNLGLDLLKSSKGTVTVQGFNGKQGPFIDSFLAYPVFQMGTEIFLKGMWLCQFPDCRALGDHAYMDPGKRGQYAAKLKELGHDLLRLIAANRLIPQYQADAAVLRFLKIIEAIIRQFYFPLYEADKRGSHWAHARYPKRFYNDAKKEAEADALQSYPQQWAVIRLFDPMERHVDQLWQLRAGLIAESQERRQAARPENGPGSAWTPEEERQLLERFDSGMTQAEIAKAHDRTRNAIVARLKKLGRIEATPKTEAPPPAPRAKPDDDIPF